MADKKVPCPFCDRMADPEKVPGEGDIICVQCGMNLLTGMKVNRGEAPKRSGSSIPVLPILGLAGAAIVVIAIAVGAFMLLTRDPVERARQAGRGGNVLEGIEILDAHTAKNPEDATAHLVMGQLYWQSGDYARAAEKFNTASRLDPGNEEAALLSVVAAVFLPLGFLTGLFGINVGGIPLADSPWGFWEVSIALLAVVLIQLAIFRWRRWF